MKIDLESGRWATTGASTPTPAASETEKSSFGKTVKGALDSVMATAKDADKAASDMVTGNVEIHEAMIRMEKADLMLKLGATVRTKMIDAYNKLLTSAGS